MWNNSNLDKNKVVNSNEVFINYTMSNTIDDYKDLMINPVLTNNTALNNIGGASSTNQSEQVEAFEQVFDDAIDMLDLDVDNLSKKDNDDDDNLSTNSLMKLLGNNFGPPAGLTIENFDYSLIQ